MVDSHVIAFSLAAAALTIAPGPDTMLVIRNVLRGGRRDGAVTAFGICAGLLVHATLSALGVSMLLKGPVWGSAGGVRGTPGARTPVVRSNTGNTVKGIHAAETPSKADGPYNGCAQ